ncbi:deaminase [Sphingomonas sp.]|uniref:deaminase n=1 Tax=Sphingomonas sp. TaxID=28214 RepID=UPI002DD65BFF|nr:deaminase [Sphingomonas sp.]
MPTDETVTNNELFIGLIAPLGVDLGAVAHALDRALHTVSYCSELVHLTSRLSPTPPNASLFETYSDLIQAGNKLRSDSVPDVFLYLAIQEIVRNRSKDGRSTSDRRVTVVRQLKRTEEVDLLRSVYGTNILFLSCYAPRAVRVKYFADKFASESRSSSRTLHEARALELISKDEHEADDPNGQRLLETYAKGDFVVDCSTPQALTRTMDRFVEAFFGYPFISPNHDEYGAYLAYSASLRSADLSRQVGAAIFQPTGEIVALGCNEVPKFGGGTYWTDDPNDARDFQIGQDSNSRLKTDMIRDTVQHLIDAGWSPPTREIDGNELDNAMINDILEFGRVIHAEMNAICDASRFGRRTSGSTLYCTTFPCHMCSRHIVAAGIERVVYLEPYHKSLARELYPDSIGFDDGTDAPTGKVLFASYAGVTPIAFQTVFSKRRRKDKTGRAIPWAHDTARPINLSTTEYLNLEQVALKQITENLGIPISPSGATDAS